MDFKQLESFVAIVKYKSFTNAAKHLYISQPTISSHMQALEEELQTPLIIRTTKNIEITPRGWELYKCASDILSLRDNLLKSWSSEKQKMIQLGVSTIPSAYIIPEILPEFGSLFPDVYFNVHQNDSQGIVDAMLSGQYDVGMIGMPCENKLLNCTPFYEDRIVMITPVNEYFLNLKKNPQITADLLRNTPIIMRENGSGSLKRADYILESMGIQPEELNVVARINDQESLKNLTASGLGVSFISEKAAENFVKEKRLLAFDLPKSLATRSLYLIYHKNNVTRPYVDQFIKFVQQYYSFSIT